MDLHAIFICIDVNRARRRLDAHWRFVTLDADVALQGRDLNVRLITVDVEIGLPRNLNFKLHPGRVVVV